MVKLGNQNFSAPRPNPRSIPNTDPRFDRGPKGAFLPSSPTTLFARSAAGLSNSGVREPFDFNKYNRLKNVILKLDPNSKVIEHLEKTFLAAPPSEQIKITHFVQDFMASGELERLEFRAGALQDPASVRGRQYDAFLREQARAKA